MMATAWKTWFAALPLTLTLIAFGCGGKEAKPDGASGEDEGMMLTATVEKIEQKQTAKQPLSAQDFLDLGYVQMMDEGGRKNWNEALANFTKAADAAGADKAVFVKANLNKGKLLREMKKTSEALAACKAACDAADTAEGIDARLKSDAHTEHGCTFERDQKTDNAESCYTMAIAADGGYPKPYWYRGRLFAKRNDSTKGDAAAAAADLKKYLELDPEAKNADKARELLKSVAPKS
ncbi:MAG: hypothetical protein HY719_12960 [Planctomycetes bacterium]|nr:hypothetical protein [Planctomycetota bacterium]